MAEIDSAGMLKYKLYSQVGFTPAAVAPPCDNPREGNTFPEQLITPEKVLQPLNRYYNSEQGITTPETVVKLQERYYIIIALSAGLVRGDRHGLLLHGAVAFYSFI